MSFLLEIEKAVKNKIIESEIFFSLLGNFLRVGNAIKYNQMAESRC